MVRAGALPPVEVFAAVLAENPHVELFDPRDGESTAEAAPDR